MNHQPATLLLASRASRCLLCLGLLFVLACGTTSSDDAARTNPDGAASERLLSGRYDQLSVFDEGRRALVVGEDGGAVALSLETNDPWPVSGIVVAARWTTWSLPYVVLESSEGASYLLNPRTKTTQRIGRYARQFSTSGDGRILVYASKPDSSALDDGVWELLLIHTDQAIEPVTLTQTNPCFGDRSDPLLLTCFAAVAPGGETVAFLESITEIMHTAAGRMRVLDTTSLSQIASVDRTWGNFVWSPDGQNLAYATKVGPEVAAQSDLFWRRMSTGSTFRATTGYVSHMAFSANGAFLTYMLSPYVAAPAERPNPSTEGRIGIVPMAMPEDQCEVSTGEKLTDFIVSPALDAMQDAALWISYDFRVGGPGTLQYTSLYPINAGLCDALETASSPVESPTFYSGLWAYGIPLGGVALAHQRPLVAFASGPEMVVINYHDNTSWRAAGNFMIKFASNGEVVGAVLADSEEDLSNNGGTLTVWSASDGSERARKDGIRSFLLGNQGVLAFSAPQRELFAFASNTESWQMVARDVVTYAMVNHEGFDALYLVLGAESNEADGLYLTTRAETEGQ